MTLIRNRTLASRTSGDIRRKIHAFALTCDCEYGCNEKKVKGEYGRSTLCADQFCLLGTYGQWSTISCPVTCRRRYSMANKPSSLTNIFYHRWILPLEVPESLPNLAFTNRESGKYFLPAQPATKNSFTGFLWLLI